MSNLVPVQVLASRSYSFTGDKGDAVNLVEVTAMIQLGTDSIIGKLNFKGLKALAPGMYTASLRAAEKAGKLVFGLTDLQPSTAPAAAAYAAAQGK